MIAHAVESDHSGPLAQLRIDMGHVRAPEFNVTAADSTQATQELARKLPKSLRPVAFADDSVFAFRIPRTNEAMEALTRLLADLATLTGLRVNVNKSEVLIIQSNPSQDVIERVSMFGEVKQCVTHLGVDISTDYDTGYSLTYQKGAQAMDKALNRVAVHTTTTNLLVKAQATNSLVTAVNLHRYRVYPPSNTTVGEQWTKVRNAMWKNIYRGETSGRPKIAKHKVTRPLKQGGLGLINPEHAATTATLSSIGSLFRHCYNNSTCMFNALEYVTEKTKVDRMVVLNGANILPLCHIYRNAFPPRADSIFESLPEVLNQLELDEHLALLAPTYGHSKESTGALFLQPLETETLRKFG